jgi:hypothetical protein
MRQVKNKPAVRQRVLDLGPIPAARQPIGVDLTRIICANDRRVPLRVESIQRGQVRTASIDCHRLGFAVSLDGLSQVAPRRDLVTMGTQEEEKESIVLW